MKFICEKIEDLPQVAEKMLKAHPDGRVFALHAEMGCGKTTFMQAVCSYLHCEDHASSPTFAIVNDYRLPDGRKIHHMDCYRINNLREAEEIGLENYFYDDSLCFVEWPENIEILLPDDTVHVYMETEISLYYLMIL